MKLFDEHGRRIPTLNDRVFRDKPSFYYKINVLMHDYSIYSCVGVKHTFSCYFAGIICPRGLFNLPLKVGFEHNPLLKIIGIKHIFDFETNLIEGQIVDVLSKRVFDFL